MVALEWLSTQSSSHMVLHGNLEGRFIRCFLPYLWIRAQAHPGSWWQGLDKKTVQAQCVRDRLFALFFLVCVCHGHECLWNLGLLAHSRLNLCGHQWERYQMKQITKIQLHRSDSVQWVCGQIGLQRRVVEGWIDERMETKGWRDKQGAKRWWQIQNDKTPQGENIAMF